MGNKNSSKNEDPTMKVKNFKGTFKKLLKYIGKYKVLLIFGIICSIASSVFSVLGPKYLGDGTTIIYEGVINIIADNGLGMDFEAIKKVVFILIGVYGASAIFWYAEGFLLNEVTLKVTFKLRKQISEKINKLPLKYFDKKTQGEVLSYITNDVDVIAQNLDMIISDVVSALILIFGIALMMILISWQMALVTFLIVPISLLLIMKIAKKSQVYYKNQQDYLGNLNGYIEEVYSNHNIVRAFNGQKESIKKANEYNDKLYDAAWKSQFLSGIIRPIMRAVSNIGYVAICILGGYYAAIGAITVGNIQSFIQYMRRFTQQVTQIANISYVIQQTMAASERVFEFLEEEELSKDPESPASIENIKGNIIFKNVNFGYTEEKTIINDFSANIEKGEKVAIVGPTGAGKTTIVKLLMRYYDINSGEILLDGTNINKFSRDDLRSNFGMVLQDTWTFSGTVMENIRYGKLDATDEEVINAAKNAQVHHFIKTLPDGYNMILNEDSDNISQGQKQLITIARVFLANPKIIILDEATSSVDTRTEILIQKAMDSLMNGRTSFVIAHRLSTIQDADCILVMNNGDIVEQGTHKELLAKGGFYEKIYNSQFEVE